MTVTVEAAPRAGRVSGLLRRLRGALALRIVLASAVLAAIVAAVFAALVVSILDLREATEREADAKRVTEATLTLEKLVVDLETGLRGFALTGDERFLRPWTGARNRVPGELRLFRTLLRSDPGLAGSANRLVDALNAYVFDYSVPVINLAREAPEVAVSREAVQEGRRRTDDIRARFAEVRSLVEAQTRTRAETASRRSEQAIAAGLAGLGLSVFLIVFLGVYLAHSIARPLRDVASRARRIAGGDFGRRLPERGPGEVGHLTRSFNTMADELARRERELDHQNARLRESERAKTELVGIVSHEVRTPLASVLGFTSLLLQREVPPDERRRYLEIIDTQGKRLQALLDGFLDVQRVEEGRLLLDRAPVDLTTLLREAVGLYAAGNPEHTLDLRLPAGRLRVVGDADRLAQAVGNLLSNAVKYSEPGGPIEVVGERDGGRVRVAVRDRGRGIAPEHQARIFTKFFRADAAASGIPGSGLGLAFTRAVVEAHGGTAGFRSVPGSGSTFWFDLPEATDVPEASAPRGEGGR